MRLLVTTDIHTYVAGLQSLSSTDTHIFVHTNLAGDKAAMPGSVDRVGR